MAVLSLSVLLFTPFFSVHVDTVSTDSGAYPLMLFAAVPWLVAGGIIGAGAAVFLAGLSGLMTAYLHTHTVFTPLVYMTTAFVFSLCIRQRYRTFFFRCVRFPLMAAFLSALIAIPWHFIALFFGGSGEIQTRMIEVINMLPSAGLAFSGTVMIGGVICVVVKMIAGDAWGTHSPLKPSPGERSVKCRVFTILTPILLFFSIVLLVSSWVTAEKDARRASIKKLTSTSNLASESLSLFIETGENLISKIAEDEDLLSQDPDTILPLLTQKITIGSYFDSLAVADSNGELIAVYPSDAPANPSAGFMEAAAALSNTSEVQLFFSGDPSKEGDEEVFTSFITGIGSPSDADDRILWGSTKLDENIYMIPVIGALNALSENNGEGLIVGNNGVVVLQTGTQGEKRTFTGSRYPTATFYEGRSSDGQSILQYYQPVGNSGWAVVTSLPTQVLQGMAWEKVYPLLILNMGLMFLVFVIIGVVLSPIDKSIEQLRKTADKAAAGVFDSSRLAGVSAGGLPLLQDAFKNMIVSFQKNQQKRPGLLTLSEQIAEQLSLKDTLQIFLLAALERGASSARILITDGSAKDGSLVPHYRMGLGEQTHAMAPLDEDILDLTFTRGEFVLRDFQIGKLVNIRKGMPYPASLISLPLEWKGTKLGVLWGTFHDRRHPEKDDIDLFKELSSLTASKIINARSLGESIETHDQLENVLDSILDPILISDNFGRIVFLNAAAQSLVDGQESSYLGSLISTVFHNENLLSLFQNAEQENQSMEIQFTDGKTYYVFAGPTQIADQHMGIVALFKDVTHYKTQDALKNEFVTTVSHELRSPLTLIHGYGKILRLTGNLSEQQENYVQNIVDRVEEMRDLVQNLLDLGRLETGDSLEIEKITAEWIIQKAIESLEAPASQKNIHLETSLPEKPIKIEADSAFLVLGLRNLVDNAIKFTKMGGNVIVSVVQRDDSVVFKVQDTGIGIAPLDQRHIFDKFQSVSVVGDENHQGRGLGLAIVKSIAEHHHGKVWFESKLGKGSTFYLQIPIEQP
jgi:signal transduction histidine kinase